jgi:5-methyltetrahydropteroyltriglutamate--homocysteine methyltransferase
MSSKHSKAEPKDVVKRRIDEASKYVALDQCAPSRQRGFSSTAYGNDLTEADEWRKLERCVAVAREVWGDA